MTSGTTTLGEVAEFINGAAFKPADWGDVGLPIIRIQNLTDTSKPFNRTLRKVQEKLFIKPGDLLVSWSATLDVFVWDREEVGLLNQHIFRVLPDTSKVDPVYLRFMLRGALDDMASHLHGATMQHVNRGEFLGTRIPLPPLPEQRRIADILDRADDLRSKRRRALQNIESLEVSLFLAMFEHNTSSDWRIAKLSEVAQFFGGNSLPQGELFSGQEDGAFLLKVSDLNRLGNEREVASAQLWSSSGGSKASTAPARSIVIPKRGGAIGTNKKRMLTRTSVLDPNLMGISAKENLVLPEYLLAWFQKLDLNTLVSGSSVPQLNKQDLAPLPIAVPPLDSQLEFSVRIGELRDLRLLASASMSALNELFASLQHRAFKGEL